MNRKIEMDNVRVGIYLTVLRGKLEQRVIPTPNGPEVRYKEKDHYNGKILEVIALDLPYIIVTCHEKRGTRNDSIDLRQVDLMKLTSQYILSLLPNFEFKIDNYWDEVKADNSLKNAGTNIEEIFKDL